MNSFPFLEYKNISFKQNFDTSAISHIRAGGLASAIAYPDSDDQLICLVNYAKDRDFRYKIIGGCSNTCFCDEGFEGVIISTSRLNSFTVSENIIKIGAGAYLSSIIKKAYDFERSFAPSLFGIPGTVGGALRNNAGALGSEISDYFLEGVFYSVREGKKLNLKKEELSFSYRKSAINSDSLIFLSGTFKCGTETPDECGLKMKSALKYRGQRHPKLPSLGSFFKRDGDIIPAFLIEKAGLKGKRIGNAAVSEYHSGFIVNLGGATAKDIAILADAVQREIYIKFGVSIKREAEIVK